MSNAKEILKDALPLIEKFAPSIAAIIGGPTAEAVANFIIHMFLQNFNVNSSNVGDLSTAIINHPQVEEKLATIENEHADFLNTMTHPPSCHVPHINVTVNVDK